MGTDFESSESPYNQKTNGERLRGSLASVQRAAENGEIAEADAKAILDFEAAFDPENATVQLPPNLYENGRKTSYKTAGTRRAWLQRLKFIAKELTLTDATASDINAYTTEKVKSGQWANKTANTAGCTSVKNSGAPGAPNIIT